MWYSFIPLLVVATLGLVKLVLIKTEDAYFTLGLCVSCICICFAFESFFDSVKFNAPLWVTSLPFALILVLATWRQFMKVHYEKNQAKRIFYCYDSSIKRIFAVVNMVATIGLFISVVAGLLAFEKAQLSKKEDNRIVRWLLFSGLIYCVLMMEFTGSLFTTLLFSHLMPDMIDEGELRKDSFDCQEPLYSKTNMYREQSRSLYN